MPDQKTLTFVLMDAPYESARSTTAYRLIDIAARRGHTIKVFAYEGAAAQPFIKQIPHANSVHACDVNAEDHPNPKEWIAALMTEAKKNGGALEWINCGLCVDERGVGEAIPGVVRGSPADLLKISEASVNTLVIPTKG